MTRIQRIITDKKIKIRVNPPNPCYLCSKYPKHYPWSSAQSVSSAFHTFLHFSIKVAEAAKVIENAQRDLNIAFVNELDVLFNKLNIDTLEVLEAAGTKWNFLPFRPGLLGDHCIGVDPYYLTHKAAEIGHHPEITLAGRRLNDSMGFRVAA